jgi:hypothetical protein
MKEKIIGVIIFVIVTCSVLVNTVVIDRSLFEIICEVDKIDVRQDNAKEMLISLYDGFKSKELFLSLSVSHDDITSIKTGFVDAISYLEQDDLPDAEVAKNRLRYFLEHLRRLSGINIDSVI